MRWSLRSECNVMMMRWSEWGNGFLVFVYFEIEIVVKVIMREIKWCDLQWMKLLELKMVLFFCWSNLNDDAIADSAHSLLFDDGDTMDSVHCPIVWNISLCSGRSLIAHFESALSVLWHDPKWRERERVSVLSEFGSFRECSFSVEICLIVHCAIADILDESLCGWLHWEWWAFWASSDWIGIIGL